jgi:hypothetical protein
MDKVLESIWRTFKAKNDYVLAGHADQFQVKLQELKEYGADRPAAEIQDDLRVEADYLVRDSVERLFPKVIKPLFQELVQVGVGRVADPIEWAYTQTNEMLSKLLATGGNENGELSFTDRFRERSMERLDSLADEERVELAKLSNRLNIPTRPATPVNLPGTTKAAPFVTRAPLQRAIELILRHSPRFSAREVADALDELENKELVKRFTDQKDFPSFSWMYNGHHPELVDEFDNVVYRVKKQIKRDKNDDSTHPTFLL